MAQHPTQTAPSLACDLIAELARQRRGSNQLSFEVVDLREVVITGPVDLIALAQIAVRS